VGRDVMCVRVNANTQSVYRLIQQLVLGTRWEHTDVLVVDLPPGTGDINLSIGNMSHIKHILP